MVARICLPLVSLWIALGSGWRPSPHALSLRIDRSRPGALQQRNDIYGLENDDKMQTYILRARRELSRCREQRSRYCEMQKMTSRCRWARLPTIGDESRVPRLATSCTCALKSTRWLLLKASASSEDGPRNWAIASRMRNFLFESIVLSTLAAASKACATRISVGNESPATGH